MNEILTGTIASAVQLDGNIAETKNMGATFSLFSLEGDEYDGAYIFTPSSTAQSVPTQNKTLLGDIYINPIPSEYVIENLQSKSVTYTPSSSTQNEVLSADEGYTGLSSVDVTVNPVPSEFIIPSGTLSIANYGTTNVAQYESVYVRTAAMTAPYIGSSIYTEDGERKFRIAPYVAVAFAGWASASNYVGSSKIYDVIPSSTVLTPSENAFTFGSSMTFLEDAITVASIPSTFVGSGVPTQGSSTYTPSSSDRTIASGTYLTGSQTIKGVNLQKNAVLTSNGQWQADEGYYGFGEVTVSVPATSATLQSKSFTFTPSTTAVGDTFTADEGYDGLSEVDITVASIPYAGITGFGGTVHASASMTLDPSTGIVYAGYKSYDIKAYPVYSDGWFASTDYTNIDAEVMGSLALPLKSAADLTASGSYINVPSGYYSAAASKSVASGSAVPPEVIGTVKGAGISNNGTDMLTLSEVISIKPSVTAGYITEGTAANRNVVLMASCPIQSATTYYASTSDQTISSSRYLAGAQTFKGVSQTNLSAENIKDGTTISISNGNGNIWSVTGTYEGGGGGGSDVQVGNAEVEVFSASSSITFTDLAGEPTSFVLYGDYYKTTSSPPVVAGLVYDGISIHGQTVTTTNNANASYDTGFSYSYNNGTLTITATTAQFADDYYYLDYTYNGTAGNIKTSDVQVGSGATSITFTDLEDEPIYWSLVFKSNFGTSSGYQRVMFLRKNSNNVYGYTMDSRANATSVYWTGTTYNNGTLTIVSNGANAGGYFHQPGFYQLTYVVSGDQSLQTKTVTPSSSTQNVTADEGYTALKKVTVNPIPSSYVQPNATKGATTYPASTSDQTIASGTYLTGTQTIKGYAVQSKEFTSNGTYTPDNGFNGFYTVTVNVAGGGSSKNTQVVQGTTRTAASTATAIGSEMTVSKTGTYDVYWAAFRSSTSGTYTYGTQLYVGGSAYGSENTTWSNHMQNNHLASVSLSANQKIRVYGRNSRGSSYYIYAPTLVIVEA